MAKGEIADLTLWCDVYKLDQSGAGAEVVWKNKELGREWQEKKASLGQNKKKPDAEIGGISETLKVGEQKATRARQYLIISILYHSQTAINKLVKMDKSASQVSKI